MLLQFASASLMNYMRDHAKGSHILKRDQAWFRWAVLSLAPAQQAPHLPGGALAAGMLLFQGCLRQCKTRAQILCHTKLQHQDRRSPISADNQELHPGLSSAL